MAALLLITFAASLIISLTGFGFSLVAMSVFPLFMSVKEANMLVTFLVIPVILVNLAPTWRKVKPRILFPVLAFAGIGIPLGIWFLVRIEESVLLICLGAVILLTLLVNTLSSKGGTWKPKIWISSIVGVVSGAFGGAYATSGPPVTLYFSRIIDDKVELKTNLLIYFLIMSGTRIVIFSISGMVTIELFQDALILLIPLFLGMVAGVFLFNRISSIWVQRIVRTLLAVSSVLLIVRALS